MLLKSSRINRSVVVIVFLGNVVTFQKIDAFINPFALLQWWTNFFLGAQLFGNTI